MTDEATRPVISRQDAKAAGLKRYFMGKMCPKGHVADRFVSSRGCTECGATPEVRAATKAWAATPEARAAAKARQATPKARAAQTARRATPKVRAYQAAYNAKPEVIIKNKAAAKAWLATPEARSHRARKYRAQRDARFATETLGIPHEVQRMEDGTFHVQIVPVTK